MQQAPETLLSYCESVFREDLFLYNSSQVEDDVEHVLQLEALARGPLVQHGVHAHADQQQAEHPDGVVGLRDSDLTIYK